MITRENEKLELSPEEDIELKGRLEELYYKLEEGNQLRSFKTDCLDVTYALFNTESLEEPELRKKLLAQLGCSCGFKSGKEKFRYLIFVFEDVVTQWPFQHIEAVFRKTLKAPYKQDRDPHVPYKNALELALKTAEKGGLKEVYLEWIKGNCNRPEPYISNYFRERYEAMEKFGFIKGD